MRKIPYWELLALSLLPSFTHAAPVTLGSMINAVTNVFKRFIPILLSLAVLVFFWGLVKFINHADDEKELEDGKQLMIWGMISLFVMIALWSIIGWIQSNLGLDDATSLGTLSAMPSAIPDTTPPPPAP